MRIIIIGAGKVGYQLAETLSKDLYDVIVVDRDEQVLKKVQDHLDVLTIQSNGFSSQIFNDIGLNKQDIVIAVTGSDEGNMLICMAAKRLGAGKTVARIRNPEYARDIVDTQERLSIDYIINPELSTANEISQILSSSPAGQIEDFAKGKVQMVAIPIDETNPLVNKLIKDLNYAGNILIVAIVRRGNIIIPKGHDEIHANDTIYITGQKADIIKFCSSIGKPPKKVNNVMILGGGKNTYYLAKRLLYLGVSVKIIEQDLERCKELSEILPNALIIHGDGTDVDLLKSENVESMDAFIALTGVDEENVLIALLAKQLGTSKVIAKVSRTNYISIVETIGVDAVVTPSMITAAEILRFIQGGNILSLFLIMGGQAESMELIAHPNSIGVNVPIKNLNFPKEAIICAIVRSDQVIVPHGSDVVKPNDRVIIFSKSSEVTKVKNLFNDSQGDKKHGFWNYFKGTRFTPAN
ncbi:MAG: Trk system potassium transporter TrkA [Clostridiales bacterium]|nr:Trk system potassium transporter TrkA [Clostridiales bacterium]